MAVPEVSVIVNAYDRKKFLLSALKSVSRQTASRESYEVIVVKNFSDNEIDSFCQSNGYSVISTERNTQGGIAAVGVKAARGRVLTFLDDDDIFAENKIEKLLDIFSDRDLVYYHNSHQLIDDNGLERPGYKFKPPIETILVPIEPDLNVRSVLWQNNLYHIGTLSFNLSSTSILREAVNPNIQYLERMIGRSDDFFFFAALKNYGGKLMIGAEPLTLYRVHLSASNPGNDGERIKKLKEKHISSSKVVMEMVEGTTLTELAMSQLVLAQADLYRMNRDFLNYIRISTHYFKAMRMNNFPSLYTVTNYLLGMLEALGENYLSKARAKFIALVSDIRA